MLKKQLILSLISLLLLTGFFLLPQNRDWFHAVRSYWNDFKIQKDRPGRETRLEQRFGSDYILSRRIARLFEQKGNKQDVLVLMPPTKYFEKNGFFYHVPEPAVFYYFTGLKTIWSNSNDAIKADWYVRVKDGKIVTDSVVDRRSFQDTIDAFKKMGVSL